MVRKGHLLEQVVHTLERALATNTEARILRNHKLPDRVTGQPREHDVVLEIQEGHHPIRIAIECRDRSRPVGVPQIEAFSQKCMDTGISCGVIVSTKGFQKTALKKASHASIKCMTLHELETLPWSSITHLTYRYLTLEKSNCHIHPVDVGVIQSENFVLIHEDGSEVTPEALKNNILDCLKILTKEQTESLQHAPAQITLVGNLGVKDAGSGKTVRVKNIICDAIFSLEITKIPMKNIRYQDESTGALVSEAVTCNVDVNGIPVTMMIMGDGSSARSVKLLSNHESFKFNPILLP